MKASISALMLIIALCVFGCNNTEKELIDDDPPSTETNTSLEDAQKLMAQVNEKRAEIYKAAETAGDFTTVPLALRNFMRRYSTLK